MLGEPQLRENIYGAGRDKVLRAKDIGPVQQGLGLGLTLTFPFLHQITNLKPGAVH